jgi:hypothetical protein
MTFFCCATVGPPPHPLGGSNSLDGSAMAITIRRVAGAPPRLSHFSHFKGGNMRIGQYRISACACVALLICLATTVLAEEKAEKKSGKKAAAANDDNEGNRLPAHFGDLVDDSQREAIYKIQDEFRPQIEELEAKLTAARDKMRAAMRDVLTPEQQKKLDDALAKAKKGKGGAKAKRAKAKKPAAEAVDAS